MKTFMIIIFGLATIRTLVPLAEYENATSFTSKLIVASMMCYCYAYFLTDIVPQLK